MLKLWFGRIAIDYLVAAYLSMERKAIAVLAEIETDIVEPNLPVAASSSSSSPSALAEEED